ncbi:apolipoprotein N-acyltransferase [Coraliomargarita parva]|uniref:apolipoprotein N-acyltransferase n=1 Tax=Coraliomargarita parva TaxID=3014050 RepID=UPI0022B5E20F|nr:apolipoprotein N-acyltransferase [Coraliomargarita parva]
MNSFRSSLFWGLAAGLLSALLWVLSIPPFEFAEGAYIAFVPLLLWLATRPGKWMSLAVAFGTGWLAWFAILVWLRHVTLIGTIALSALLGFIFALWVLLARWIWPRLVQRPFVFRLLGFSGLAGAWVLLEWVRTWLFWGFPWAPLALSQWDRTVVLQIAAWTGAYGVSFLLIFFNCCVSQTLWHRISTKERKMWTGWFSPDLYAALGCLGLCFYVFFHSLPARGSEEALFVADVVQPYIPAELKWDTDREVQNLETLEWHSRAFATSGHDLLLWPEAATPWPIIGYDSMQTRVEMLSNELQKPILMGNLKWDREADLWYNGACLVEPGTGLAEPFYSKRELVPFGEYVPPPFDVIVDKFVEHSGNFEPGDAPNLLTLHVRGHAIKVGPLVCYEDVFPRLARASVQAGAEVLFVTTNNAWYGEEGGAYQHAAHSVLRAVENRRPVMRCGNGGWSGSIDAMGAVHSVLLNENGSVYFRGGGSFGVIQFGRWERQQSFYTRHGDWFVWVSAGFALVAVGLSRIKA